MSSYGKLVRDRIPEQIERNGEAPRVRCLSEDEFAIELRKKLLEAAHEVTEAEHVETLVEELADVMEVIQELSKLYDINPAEIEAARINKLNERGGFVQRIYLDSVE